MPKKLHSIRNNGKKYEGKVGAMARKLYPSATIKENVKLPAKITSGKRQVDILIDTDLGRMDFEAKDHTRRIGINDIASYEFKLRDEGVSTGIIVSNSPYTKSAIETARHFGNIRPADLIDTADQENHFRISSSVLLKTYYISSCYFSLRHRSELRDTAMDQELGRQRLVSESGDEIQSAYKIIEQLWNSGFLFKKAKQATSKIDKSVAYTYTLSNQKIIAVDDDSILEVDEFCFHYTIDINYREGQWTIKHAQGFYSASENSFHTNQLLESDMLSVEELHQWKPISAEEVAQNKYTIHLDSLARLSFESVFKDQDDAPN